MDSVVIAEVMRMAERILVVAGGIVSICLGYLLFRLATVKQDSEGKFTASGIEFAVSRVGPGVFFAMFGAYVLHDSLTHSISATPQTGASAAALSALQQITADLGRLQAWADTLPAADKEKAASLVQQLGTDLVQLNGGGGFTGSGSTGGGSR
jgi:hypothetical protein